MSIWKLTQLQRRASRPRRTRAISCQEPSIERQPAPPKHESESCSGVCRYGSCRRAAAVSVTSTTHEGHQLRKSRASRASLRRPSMRARAAACVDAKADAARSGKRHVHEGHQLRKSRNSRSRKFMSRYSRSNASGSEGYGGGGSAGSGAGGTGAGGAAAGFATANFSFPERNLMEA